MLEPRFGSSELFSWFMYVRNIRIGIATASEPSSSRSGCLSKCLRSLAIVAGTDGKEDVRVQFRDFRPQQLTFVVSDFYWIVVVDCAIQVAFISVRINKRFKVGRRSVSCSATKAPSTTFY